MSQVQQRVDYPFLRISHLPPGVENILSSDVPIATGRGTCPSENLGGIHVHFHSSFFLIFWCFSVRHSDFSFRAKRSCSPHSPSRPRSRPLGIFSSLLLPHVAAPPITLLFLIALLQISAHPQVASVVLHVQIASAFFGGFRIPVSSG